MCSALDNLGLNDEIVTSVLAGHSIPLRPLGGILPCGTQDGKASVLALVAVGAEALAPEREAPVPGLRCQARAGGQPTQGAQVRPTWVPGCSRDVLKGGRHSPADKRGGRGAPPTKADTHDRGCALWRVRPPYSSCPSALNFEGFRLNFEWVGGLDLLGAW